MSGCKKTCLSDKDQNKCHSITTLMCYVFSVKEDHIADIIISSNRESRCKLNIKIIAIIFYLIVQPFHKSKINGKTLASCCLKDESKQKLVVHHCLKSHHACATWTQNLSSEQPCAEDILCSTENYKILEIRMCFISVAAVTASRLR